VQGVFNFLPDADLSPILLVGGSWLRTELGGQRNDSGATRGGLGVQYQPEGSALGFRADAVERHEFNNSLNPQKNNYDDLIYSVGLTYRFGLGSSVTSTAGYTAPLGTYTPATQPVQQVAAAQTDHSAKAVHSSFKGRVSTGVSTPNDSDGDGVPNAQDKCSDTPANAVVDADGCIIYLKKL
jgi:OOP family OmpA-OmpF porin